MSSPEGSYMANMLFVMNRALSLITAFVAIGFICRAQDTHYWTQQFGTRSALLGGAVVGGANDNTAIYYNPAGLAFSDTGSISISGNLYHIQSFRIQNALGNKVDFKSTDLGSVPLLVSGMFRTHNKDLRIGYAILQPVNFDFKAIARLDGFYPIFNDTESPGNEEFICQRSISSSVHEVMVAFGLAYKLSDHWAIGLSNLFTSRSQSYTNITIARAYLNDSSHTLVTADQLQNFHYFHLRYSAKLGISWQGDKLSAGLALTTPGLRITGKGSVGADYTGTNIKLNGLRQDVLADDMQGKLKSTYKYPISISAGLNWKPGRSLLALSVQYFGSEAVYDMLRGAPAAFVRPAGVYPNLGADEFLRVKSAARKVLNGVIGYDHPLSRTVTLQCSFRNDMTYYDKDLDYAPGIKPDITTWNIYTLTAGAAIRYGRSFVTIGLVGSRGNDNHHAEQGNFSQPGQGGFLQGVTTITKASYSSFGLLLGYTYNFRKI